MAGLTVEHRRRFDSDKANFAHIDKRLNNQGYSSWYWLCGRRCDENEREQHDEKHKDVSSEVFLA